MLQVSCVCKFATLYVISFFSLGSNILRLQLDPYCFVVNSCCFLPTAGPHVFFSFKSLAADSSQQLLQTLLLPLSLSLTAMTLVAAFGTLLKKPARHRAGLTLLRLDEPTSSPAHSTKHLLALAALLHPAPQEPSARNINTADRWSKCKRVQDGEEEKKTYE